MGQQPRAAVKNAADAEQVKRAARRDRDRERLYLDNLRGVMGDVHGRYVMWELLAKAGVFHSIYHPSSLIYYNAGRQDFGHELMANLIAADPALYQCMEQEARTREARDS